MIRPFTRPCPLVVHRSKDVKGADRSLRRPHGFCLPDLGLVSPENLVLSVFIFRFSFCTEPDNMGRQFPATF